MRRKANAEKSKCSINIKSVNKNQGRVISEMERFIYKLSYKYPNSVFWINKMDTNRVLNKYEGVGRFMEFQYLKIPRDFNAQIIIPYSPVGD